MSNPIDDKLINLAYEIVNLKGHDKQIDFGKYTDRQGELHLCWANGKFVAELTVFSDPYTSGLYSPIAIDPPETIWREETDEFESVKIVDIANWLRDDWHFDLAI